MLYLQHCLPADWLLLSITCQPLESIPTFEFCMQHCLPADWIHNLTYWFHYCLFACSACHLFPVTSACGVRSPSASLLDGVWHWGQDGLQVCTIWHISWLYCLIPHILGHSFFLFFILFFHAWCISYQQENFTMFSFNILLTIRIFLCC